MEVEDSINMIAKLF